MKVEFSVFKKLFDSNPNLKVLKHNVHKVLMNIFYLFFPDFTDKDVKVIVGDNSKNTAYFDYESVHVALYHLIENSAKYIKIGSTLKIEIGSDNSYSHISMDMVSTEIKESEKNKIFLEGYSGQLPSKIGKSGDGIGMFIAQKIIELNSGEISVTTYPETLVNVRGFNFQRNVFTIKLPKNR